MLQQETVTIVVGCPAEKVWLVAFQPAKGYYLPQYQGKCTSWTASAIQAYKMFTGQETQNPILWKVFRIWQSDSLPHLTNVIFRIIVTPDVKKKITLPGAFSGMKDKYLWLTQEELATLVKQKELTREINCYVPVGSKETEPLFQLLENQFPICDKGLLVEISKGDIITNVQYLQHPSDMLLAGCKLLEKDQTILYKEYLSITYPFVLMDLNGFKKICPKIGMPTKLATDYFRAADIDRTGCISFKDLIHLIAAIEPKVLHTGTGLEFRIKLIFRYYDKDSDGRLEFNEFKEIFRKMNLSKFDNATIIKLFRTELDLDEGESINLQTFLFFLTEMKLKGLSNVLVNSNSIFESIERLTKLPTNSFSHQVSDYSGGVLQYLKKLPRCPDNEEKEEYTLGSHCVCVGKIGMLGLEQLPSSAGSSAADLLPKKTNGSDIITISRPSLPWTDRSHPSSIVLSALKDFATAYTWDEEGFKHFTVSLKEICINLVEVFKQEPRMVMIKSPVYILGDIHGNYRDICIFENQFWSMGIHLTPVSLLFLGDYVDRGEFGVEVVGYLFAQKLRNPQRVFLIRGNHEIRDVQKNFTFHLECLKKFGSLGHEMFNHINNVFDCLPLAAVVDEKIFCCHGGIPPPWLCPSISVINKIPCPLVKIHEESTLAWELVWNDPIKDHDISSESLKIQLSLNEGFAVNKRRGTGHVFNYEALLKFLKINNLTFVVRAHESQQSGYQLHFKNKLFTVFSTSRYFNNNDAACILAQDRKLRIFRMNTDSFYSY